MTRLYLRARIEGVDHLDALRGEGAAFAGVLNRADAGLPVPGCGDWRLRELSHHLGKVHRWAAAAGLDRAAVPTAALRLTAHNGLGSWLVAGPSPAATICGPAEALLLLLWGHTDLDDPRLQVEERSRAQAVLAEPLTP